MKAIYIPHTETTETAVAYYQCSIKCGRWLPQLCRNYRLNGTKLLLKNIVYGVT